MHEVEAKGILSSKNGINIYIYMGCTHGCIYCDSRSRCYQMNHDFEDIEVKVNARELLEDALKRKRKKCMIGTGAMSDPYIHLEDKLENILGILDYCVRAKVKGIICFGIGLTLRDGNRQYFYKNLDKHFPGMKAKYIEEYAYSYEVNSPNNGRLMDIISS